MNKETLQKWSNFIWYQDNFIGLCLLPFSMIFNDIARFRRYLYRIGLLKKHKLSVPVIIVGNITVGGTGKTPLTIYIVGQLKQLGYKPGVIARGYGGESEQWPKMVFKDCNPAEVGDEPLVIARHNECPIAVGPDRVATAKLLLEQTDCNVIISDDGLQHYRLERDIEIIVIDGERRFGNGYSLPSGPLREAVSRIREVDFLVCNGGNVEEDEFPMVVQGQKAINLLSGEQQPLNYFKNKSCYAVAGIGNPQRFFSLLDDAGISYQRHVFSDHHDFTQEDLRFEGTGEILMTEKDSVKCAAFAQKNYWHIPVTASLPGVFTEKLVNKLEEKMHG